jgi:hypothetical protein
MAATKKVYQRLQERVPPALKIKRTRLLQSGTSPGQYWMLGVTNLSIIKGFARRYEMKMSECHRQSCTAQQDIDF